MATPVRESSVSIVNGLYPALSAAQEESLCAFLLTVHTFGSTSDVAKLMQERYAVEYTEDTMQLSRRVWLLSVKQPLCRRCAYILLRWAQMHPHDFALASGRALRSLWQRVARDGYLAVHAAW